MSALHPAAIAGPISAWRLFSLNDDGRLLPPFADHYWPHTLTAADVWQPDANVARCLTETHRVPSVECGCGLYGVRDLDALLTQAKALHFTGHALSVLDTSGVLARVRLEGLILPAPVGTGTTDPDSTVRASVGTLVELFLPTRNASLADALQERYAVPVHVCRRWPQIGSADERFLASLPGFGFLQLNRTEHTDLLLGLAHNLVEGIRGGLVHADAATALFDSGAKPTWTQALGFVDAALLAYAPELIPVQHRGAVAARPLTIAETISRSALHAISQH